jgi:DNA-binding NtrC family response regulator
MITYDSISNEPYFGTSPAAEKVKRFISKASSSPCAVLLLGDSGTGKGVVARHIHYRSHRREREFVSINCAGLKGELLKSELFGHVRGAFTGAINDRPGLIEEADGGTLFLDEIGDMDVGVQCQILKAVEEKTFRRIGENKSRSSDFRLICATNRDLPKAMDNGTFREDLFYRINTLTTRLPSLKECVGDIPGLLNHILKKMRYSYFPICDSIVRSMVRRRWRGNIRELRNMIEKALASADGGPLTIEHFSDSIEEAPKAISDTYSELAETPAEYRVPPLNVWNLDDLEKAHIYHALKHFQNDKAKTCNALGISSSSLYRKLEKFKLRE